MNTPHEPTYFIDRDLGRRFAGALRSAGLHVQRAGDHSRHDTADEVWIPVVARRGWLAVTRDGRIRYSRLALTALMSSGALANSTRPSSPRCVATAYISGCATTIGFSAQPRADEGGSGAGADRAATDAENESRIRLRPCCAGGDDPAMSLPSSGAVTDVVGRIRWVRGQRVLLDSDLAALYGVFTHRLNEAVKRNPGRFPEDFAFRRMPDEYAALLSQIAISKVGRGGRRRSLPQVFTEHGAIMAATVLNNPRAVEMSLYIVRAFVRLRAVLASNMELSRKFAALEKSVATLDADCAASSTRSMRLFAR